MSAATAEPGVRTRRRRRLAAAVRALAAEEARPAGAVARLSAFALHLRGRRAAAGTVAEPVLAGLRALAEDGQGPAPADADAPELLARMPGAAAIPAEICVALGAVLLPLLRHAAQHEPAPPAPPPMHDDRMKGSRG